MINNWYLTKLIRVTKNKNEKKRTLLQIINYAQGKVDTQVIVQALEELVEFGIILDKFNLSNIDLSYAELSYGSFRGSNLSKADLRHADLSFTDLSRADLSHADLSFTDLSNANLSVTNLSSANLSNANLSHANLYYKKALLRSDRTDFRGAKNLTPEQVKSAKNWQQAEYNEEFRKKLGLK